MRACAILGCKRIVSVIWNILYVLYSFVILGVALWFWNHAGRECSVSILDVIRISPMFASATFPISK